MISKANGLVPGYLTIDQAWEDLWQTLRDMDLTDMVDLEIDQHVGSHLSHIERLNSRLKTPDLLSSEEEFKEQEYLENKIVEIEREIGRLNREYSYDGLDVLVKHLESASRVRDLVRVKSLWGKLNATAFSFSGQRLISPGLEDKIERLLVILDEGSSSLLFKADEGEDLSLREPQIVTELDLFLASRIANRPELLHSLSPRQFEMLIADFFSSFGYKVELTARTRDGGRDLIAVRRDNAIVSKLLVECKKYAPERRVGVSLVRELYAVKTMERATKAILATTAMFSRDARAIEAQHLYELELKDFSAVSAWARDYAKWVKGIRSS